MIGIGTKKQVPYSGMKDMLNMLSEEVSPMTILENLIRNAISMGPIQIITKII